MSADFESEQKDLKSTIKELRETISIAKNQGQNVDRFLEAAQKEMNLEELRSEDIHTLLERIEIYEKSDEANEKGKKLQEVKLIYWFVGALDELEENLMIAS